MPVTSRRDGSVPLSLCLKVVILESPPNTQTSAVVTLAVEKTSPVRAYRTGVVLGGGGLGLIGAD